MNVLTAILDTKAKRDDIEAAMAAVKEQVTAMETGVTQPDLALEVAEMKKLLQQKADKRDLVGCVPPTPGTRCGVCRSGTWCTLSRVLSSPYPQIRPQQRPKHGRGRP